MFTGKQPNPYDEIVTKTTDENLTSENWELILNLCDKVNDEGEQGARNVIAAVLKRLAHRNPTVQLYALALGEALSKNCGIELHREMASRAFTQGLEKLVTDRMTHEKVKRRALHLISLWSGEFEENAQLGLMEELYNTLKSKNYKFDEVSEPPPAAVDDEVRRKEEEELQRVLEMSVHDKGGRNFGAWKDTSTSSGAEASSASASASTSLPGPSSSGGYTPTQPPRSAYSASEAHHSVSTVSPDAAVPSDSSTQPAAVVQEQSSSSGTATLNSVTRVRALHTFEPTVAGELAFEKGDIIKVTDRAYDNWWRGQLRGRTGIFPVNYVEPLPDLTPGELAREAEQEAAVFAQAANIDKLISMLRGLDPAKDNLADNEEIQELYRSSMALRPKIVKLIDKYSQKRAELVAMNENFVKARAVFEEMMEDSLARHTGVYDTTQPTFRIPRPDSRTAPADYHASNYGWNPALYDQPGYNAYPAAPSAYNEQPHPQPHNYQGQVYNEPTSYSGHQQQNSYGQVQPQVPQQYPPVDGYSQHQQPQQQSQQLPQQSQQLQQQSQQLQQQSQQLQQQSQQQQQQHQHQQPPSHGQTQPPQQSQAYGHATGPGSDYPQPYGHGPVPTEPAAYAQQNPQSQIQPQPQSQPQQGQQQQGPPYVYDPKTQYADPNVHAWAQYYAQGGKDTAGAVYFISVPGVTDNPDQSSAADAGQPTQQGKPPATATEVSSDLSSAQAQASYPAYGVVHNTSPPQDQAQYIPQGQPAYGGYGSTSPQSTSPSADQAKHPSLHVQPGYQPSSDTTQAGLSGTHNTGPATPYGLPSINTPASYIPGAYPATRGPMSPHEGHPGYQPQGQPPSTSGLQQGQAPPVASEGVGA